ncbi:hypothetical protein K439DRAFT_1374062, partial [Ramaria rubella]
IDTFLEHMMGWKKKDCRSKPRGGLFGCLHSYYGTTECMEQGSLHGHFLIWLDDGLNPNELHTKLAADKDFQ